MSLRCSIQLAPSPFASSSRLTLPRIQARLKKTAAATGFQRSAGNTGGYSAEQGSGSAADTRVQLMQRVLYPSKAYNPRSAAPTGTYPPQHIEKLHAVIQHHEVQDTIERAWRVFRRKQRIEQQKSLEVRFRAMEEACDELATLTVPEPGGPKPPYDQSVYDAAVSRPNVHKQPKFAIDRKASDFDKWRDTRLAGLMPRELWVPMETKGTAWNYGWKRPSEQ